MLTVSFCRRSVQFPLLQASLVLSFNLVGDVNYIECLLNFGGIVV